MLALYTAFAALLGLGIGSFLNVVIWRVPRGESVVAPSSACPKCGNPLKTWHNIPIISWIILRAKCGFCSARISSRYPLVEAGTAITFGMVTSHWGISWALPALLYFGAVGIALAIIDLDLKILPDKIVLPSYLVLSVLLTLASLNPGGQSFWSPLARSAVGMVALLVLYGAAWWFYPKGMGFGDVKLSGVLGLLLGWFGWGALAIGTFAGFLFGGIGGIIMLSLTKKGKREAIPFGPWMILGAWFGLLFGEAIWSVYLDSFL